MPPAPSFGERTPPTTTRTRPVRERAAPFARRSRRVERRARHRQGYTRKGQGCVRTVASAARLRAPAVRRDTPPPRGTRATRRPCAAPCARPVRPARPLLCGGCRVAFGHAPAAGGAGRLVEHHRRVGGRRLRLLEGAPGERSQCPLLHRVRVAFDDPSPAHDGGTTGQKSNRSRVPVAGGGRAGRSFVSAMAFDA